MCISLRGQPENCPSPQLVVGGHDDVDFKCPSYQFGSCPKLLASLIAEWLERWSPSQEVPVRFPVGASCGGPERFQDSSSLLGSAFHGVADTR